MSAATLKAVHDCLTQLQGIPPHTAQANTATSDCTDSRVHGVLRNARNITACTAAIDTIVPTSDEPSTPVHAKGRLMLLAFAMHVHPLTFFDNTTDAPTTVLVEHAAQLVATLVGICASSASPASAETSRGFVTRYTAFCKVFHAWRARDAEVLVQTLVDAWVNVDDTREQWLAMHGQDQPRKDTTFLHHLERTLVQLQHRAERLGTDTTTFLQQVRKTRAQVRARASNDVGQTVTRSPIEATVHQAFWDDFKRRLQQGDTEQLKALLHELTHKLKGLTPLRSDLHTALDQSVDIALVVQMVKHQSYDADHFLEQCRRLVHYLCTLAAPVVAQQLRTWFDKWTTQWHTGEHTFETLLPLFFQRMHTDIDRTMRATAAFRDALDQQHQARPPAR